MSVLFRAILLLLLLGLFTACNPEPTDTPLPTVTPLPIPEYDTPTEPPALATNAALTREAADEVGDETPEPALDPTTVARGMENWERLECASCHGENGEGSAGEIDGSAAPALQGITLSQAEFIDWLRTGGDLGNDHLYSTDRLSDRGGRNLYAFVLTLGSDE